MVNMYERKHGHRPVWKTVVYFATFRITGREGYGTNAEYGYMTYLFARMSDLRKILDEEAMREIMES